MFPSQPQLSGATTIDTPGGNTPPGLDPDSLSMGTLARELALQRRPSWLLCKFMSALERQRQSRGMGWSRPWNKTDLTIFRTHTHELPADAAYFAAAETVLQSVLASVPEPYASFARELWADPARMAFTFYHNRETDGARFEGLTISFGRRVRGDASKRDRVDLILEDRCVDGRVDGQVDLLRVYVCPWSEFQHERRHHLFAAGDLPAALAAEVQSLHQTALERYAVWREQPARQWQHWSQRYIDYFGPRRFIPMDTSFD